MMKDYLSDAQTKIYYKDGTTKIVNIGGRIDGFYFNYDDKRYKNHLIVGDDNEIVISYMGNEVTMYVSIVEKSEGMADITIDGKVDAKDRTILARHIAEWEGYEKLPLVEE